MDANSHTISVIICAYTERRWQDLLDAVDSLQRQTRPPDEVIVVIDHNPDLLRRATDALPGAQVIANAQQRGLSGARNTAIAIASGSILAFMDEDATARADWLDQLLLHYASPSVMGVGGQIVPLHLEPNPAWFPEEFQWVVGCTYRGMPETAAPVRNLIGCNMSFRREVFDAVGDFRNEIGRIGTLPVGCEETELCIRARQRWPAREFIYEPAAVVDHRVPPARTTWRYFLSRCYSEGISKALIAQFVGAQDSLSSERSYVLRVLPLGVLRGVAGVFRGEVRSAGRSVAIVAGLLVTGIGFLKERSRQFWRARAPQRRREGAYVWRGADAGQDQG